MSSRLTKSATAARTLRYFFITGGFHARAGLATPRLSYRRRGTSEASPADTPQKTETLAAVSTIRLV